MVQDFAGTTALVTGSNSGPSKVAAQQPAERGAPRDSQQPGQAARAELKPLVFDGSVTVGGALRRDTYLAKPRTRTDLEGFFAAGDVVERTYPLRGRHGCGTLAGHQRTLTQRVLARREPCTRHN